MKKKIIVRFAPSPTGPLHIGNLRIALFNFLFSKKYNGKFILRIDDTDKKRIVKNSLDYILKSLKWFKIDYDEGYKKNGKNKPYKQSKRLKIYKKYLKILLKKKLAYYAYDDIKDINYYKKKNKYFLYNSINRNKLKNSLNKNYKKKKKKKYVIRLKTPKNKLIVFNDKIYGKIKINTNKIDDKIIYRTNKMPTYHFANVIDDYLMNITHVIRGKEWIYSTPIHIILCQYLNFKIPNYIHLPLILNKKKGKISKRLYNLNKNIIYPINSQYKNLKVNNSFEENGYLPESLINLLFILGNKKINDNKIINLKKMIKIFNFKNFKKNNIYFNYKKLLWINKQYIINNKKIKKIIFLKIKKKLKNQKIKNKFIKKIINLIIDRLNLINIKSIWNNCVFFFKRPNKYIYNKYIFNKIKKNKKEIISFFLLILFSVLKKKKINIKKIYLIKILRLSLIGNINGLEITKIINNLNIKEIIKRIKYLLKNKLFTNTKFIKNII
ncbi:MAG: glutamate--tRNA ligase [Candidatus Shikimatogenerans sp. JK-2022]|nr:glutamate--tRNA ligase [Candidatus Shikimatogenerans bostrichidophilus]